MDVREHMRLSACFFKSLLSLSDLLIGIIRDICLSYYAGHGKELNFQTMRSLLTIFDLVIPLQKESE